MAETTIEYTDEVSNPLMARPVGDTSVKIGTFCEKPDSEGTCKNCWAETLNLRFGNRLTFDKANRDKIEWVYKQKPMDRLRSLNADKRESGRNPGSPLMIFCCDTFDLFQPSISDDLRNRIFDEYDQFTNLTLQIQTTYPAKMKRYIKARYNDNIPDQFWFGMSTGNQKFLDKNIEHLLEINSAVRYVIFEPCLGGIELADPIITETWEDADQFHHGDWDYIGHPFEDRGERVNGFAFCKTCGNRRGNPMHNNREFMHLRPEGYAPQTLYVNWVIVGGESGTSARGCDIEWIRSLKDQCRTAEVPILIKQLGSHVFNSKYLEEPHRIKLEDSKGKIMDEWPEDLRIREFPKV